MMEGLIVWAAIGPILAFVAGVIVVAWWDDEEDEDLTLRDHPCRTGGAILGVPGGVPGQVPFFEPYGHGRPAWVPLPETAVGHPVKRTKRSCLQCGWREEWP